MWYPTANNTVTKILIKNGSKKLKVVGWEYPSVLVECLTLAWNPFWSASDSLIEIIFKYISITRTHAHPHLPKQVNSNRFKMSGWWWGEGIVHWLHYNENYGFCYSLVNNIDNVLMFNKNAICWIFICNGFFFPFSKGRQN